jgi:hypothetical protein
MTVSFANPWLHAGAIMLVPAYVLFLLARRKLKKCGNEIQSRNLAAALRFCFLQLRWHVLSAALAFAISVALVVGINRLFVGIEAGDTRLTLDYPWPRSNVHLNWEDITQANVETQQFRFRYMFRLRVEAGSKVYWSPWNGKEETQRALDIIQAHLGKPEKNSAAN